MEKGHLLERHSILSTLFYHIIKRLQILRKRKFKKSIFEISIPNLSQPSSPFSC